jgi:hypothetical protein
MCHDNAPKHSPKLDGPLGRPPTLRHGQMASQLARQIVHQRLGLDNGGKPGER